MPIMKRISLRGFTLVALLLCTASCKDVTHIQTGYLSDRGDCRSRAEDGTSTYAGGTSVSGKERNTMLLQLFCECMKDRAWNVAGCKYKDKDIAKAAPVQQQPTIVVVQAPPAAVVAPAPVAECPLPPAKSKSKKRPKRKIDGTCPAPEEYGQSELDQILNKAQ